jgi:hypothetical protein
METLRREFKAADFRGKYQWGYLFQNVQINPFASIFGAYYHAWLYRVFEGGEERLADVRCKPSAFWTLPIDLFHSKAPRKQPPTATEGTAKTISTLPDYSGLSLSKEG